MNYVYYRTPERMDKSLAPTLAGDRASGRLLIAEVVAQPVVSRMALLGCALETLNDVTARRRRKELFSQRRAANRRCSNCHVTVRLMVN
jgi:hypothetical protein